MSQDQLKSQNCSASKRWRVGLVVDHPRRDLEGLVHLARALQSRGLQPALIPMYQQGIDQALLALDAIVVNYFRPNNATALREWRADGLSTFVLDTEGGILSESGHDSPRAFAAALAELNAAESVDGYLFWGARLADAVRESGALPADRIAVTGCPRFDLCAEPWRRRLGERSDEYVLINTNFSLINPAQTSGMEREAAVMVESGWGPDYVRRLVADLRAVFRKYLDSLDALIAALPDQRFRIRPHPFEDHAIYIDRFSKRHNVEVNGNGSVATAAQRAACVLHLNCGSAIEAVMLERVPVQLEFLNTDIQRAHAPLPGRVSAHATSLQDLIDLLRRRDLVAERFDLAATVRRELQPFFGPSGGGAAEKTADFIAARLQQIRTQSRTFSLRLALGSGRQHADAGQYLQGLIGTVLGTAVAARLREIIHPARRSKRFRACSVDAILRELAACAPGVPVTARQARHALTGLPLESVLVELAR